MQNEKTIPHMETIKEVSEQTGIPYHTIRQLCLERRIVYIKAGNKYLVNFDKFIDFLNTGETGGNWADIV